ncbi:hypothetical protein H6F77_08740 [Microcoleus sp. FACHB-831]|uniref:hypothetical protein n=1 Tax=Microcoleus sp. FACHB-831 TaxID=2692827 RepID=UPI001686F918|nr:hypothetical protein [Microcoleus sp. FACHB-831]MBD1921177.1 hypothetical protein [Microcoleus sp. FACHB-831]
MHINIEEGGGRASKQALTLFWLVLLFRYNESSGGAIAVSYLLLVIRYATSPQPTSRNQKGQKFSPLLAGGGLGVRTSPWLEKHLLYEETN